MNYYYLDFERYLDEICCSESESLLDPQKTCPEWANSPPSPETFDLSNQCYPIPCNVTVQVNLKVDEKGVVSVTIAPTFTDFFPDY